ncbi:sortase [Christensenellaceae bacterium OttesenSCG-928-L17]|nr:sortase [Christensenellaceae bacterium OttesenSCG-928-L17]
MKRVFAILLIALTLFSAIACNKQDPDPDMVIGTPAATTDDPGDASSSPGPATSPNAPTTSGSFGDSSGMTPPPLTSATPTGPATPTPTVLPSEDPGTAVKIDSYEAAKEINKDTIGWIEVPNTNISYPIMYNNSHTKTGGSWYYNNHDIYKKTNTAGSIYSYHGQKTKNMVVTGHNMRTSGTMFHELHKIQNNKSNLSTRANRVFKVRLFGYREFEVFALYETSDNESEKTLQYNTKHLSGEIKESEVKEWIDYQKSRSEIKDIVNVSVSTEDFFLTLITCGDDHDYPTAQSRLYIFLKAC